SDRADRELAATSAPLVSTGTAGTGPRPEPARPRRRPPPPAHAAVGPRSASGDTTLRIPPESAARTRSPSGSVAPGDACVPRSCARPPSAARPRRARDPVPLAGLAPRPGDETPPPIPPPRLRQLVGPPVPEPGSASPTRLAPGPRRRRRVAASNHRACHVL